MSKESFIASASPLNIVYLADGNIQRKLTRSELARVRINSSPANNQEKEVRLVSTTPIPSSNRIASETKDTPTLTFSTPNSEAPVLNFDFNTVSIQN